MFGIFQADLPIGRTIWLVALTLVASSLLFGTPRQMPSDSIEFAFSMVVYTGHSLFFGMLYSFLPNLMIRAVDIWFLLRRSRSWTKSALLYEDYRYDWVGDICSQLGVVCAAAAAVQQFGEASLKVSGLCGIGFLLLSEVLGLERFLGRLRGPLLELRATGSRSAARLFLSGAPFAEIRLDEDFGTAMVRLRAVGWEPDSVAGTDSYKRVWLRKDVFEYRMRIIAGMVDRQFTREGLIADIKSFATNIAVVIALAGWLTGLSASVFGLYLAQQYNPDSFVSVLLTWSQGLGVAVVGMAGMAVFVSAMLALRLIRGVSLFTGKPKRGRTRRVTADPIAP